MISQKLQKCCLNLCLTVAVVPAVFAAGPAAAQAAEQYSVTYRCSEWNTFHFDDAKKAKLHFDTVRKLGCEAAQDNHGGHIDVSYRCPEWKQIAFKDHDATHRWEQWLKDAGFETRHAH